MTPIATVIAASMCLQGGEQVDLSRYFLPTTTVLELKVTFRPGSGQLIIYSPGYEDREVLFTGEQSYGLISFAEPILCVKALGGPFEFNIEIMPMEEGD